MLAAADRRLGLSDALAALIPDDRDPALITHSVADILRERIFAIACDATEKECASCHVIKPIDAFHRDRTNTDGRWVYCENCQQRLQAASRVHDLTAAFSNFYQVARTRARSKSLPFTISKQDLADIWTGDCAVCRIHTGQRASAGAGRHSAIFRVIPPSVHQMLLTLEREGLISRRPGVARSIAVLLDRADLPELQPGYGQPVKTTVQKYWPDTMSRRNRIPHSR